MTKYFRQPGLCPDCGHMLGIHKQKEKYTYYVCHPCRHKEYPGKDIVTRSYHLKKKGLTTLWYDQMLDKQGGRCAICFCPPTEMRSGKIKRLNIDHDHRCCSDGCIKCVRGLLCSNCNRALGKFDDDIIIMSNAINYLKTYQRMDKK